MTKNITVISSTPITRCSFSIPVRSFSESFSLIASYLRFYYSTHSFVHSFIHPSIQTYIMTLTPSSSEGSVVLVEHEDGTTLEKEVPQATDDADAPHAVNIVSIGTEATGYAFQFHPERLQAILSKVPSHYKVKVVSVVCKVNLSSAAALRRNTSGD